MDEFAAGTDVTLTIEHQNNGQPLFPTSLQYQVLDAHGTVLVDWTVAPLFALAATSTAIKIDRTANVADDKIDARQVNVRIYTDAGLYNQSVFYRLIGDQTTLTPMVDSFMTFPESIIMRIKTTEPMEYFDALDDGLKAIALENAFRAIVKLKFLDPTYKCANASSYFDRDFGSYGYNSATWATEPKPIDISKYTLAQFNALPADMIAAIKKAQIIQANALVENSPVRDKIRQGIISETIGESSMFFKQNFDFATLGTQLPSIADPAYTYLKNWLFRTATGSQTMRIGRG